MSLNGKAPFKHIKPKPPPTLTKETIGVWSGWGNLSDKEVAREAAAKGSHVDLAISFLSARTNKSYENAQSWFTSEVIKWVSELLERKQIFKASHILNNIGLDPALELSKEFYSTNDNNLREYIGNHLIKIEKLSDHLKELWAFHSLIQENNLLISKYNFTKENIECLDKQSSDIKAEVATILFLKTDDIKLINFINSETLWRYLLLNKDVNNLLTWINLRYQTNFESDTKGSNIVEQFKKYPITDEMINLVASSDLNIPHEIRETIYNEFSKFGIFSSKEKDNFIVILERLKNSFSIANLYETFTKNSSLISLDKFIKLLCDYCVDKELFSILSVCVKDFQIIGNSRDLNLIKHFRLLVNNCNENLLRDNIFKVSRILSSDILSYLSNNPAILLALVFFTRGINIQDIITKKSSLTIENVILDQCILHMSESLPILKSVCQNQIEGTPTCKLTIYDLIDKHLKIDSPNLFEFRFKENSILHFNAMEVVQNYGYSKHIDYKFYLKQSRPSTAAKLFILKELETYDFIIEDDLKRIEKKVCKFATANFDSGEITTGCISFMAMVGLDATKLRVMIKTANILYDFGYEKVSVQELISNSDDEPYTIQHLLETNLMQNIEINLLLTGSQLLEAFKIYEIVIQYSKLNNIKLPELFLKFCASRNLWLPFLIFAQIYNYPLDQIKLLIQFFKSPNMLEHLTHGVINDIQVEEKNILIKDRDSRKSFLSKVGVRTSIEILNQTPTHSIKSQSSRESQDSTASSDIFEIDISNIKATLLQTLIRCHNSTDPPKALLQACQLYRNPLLAIFATSYEPDSIITNWLTWLAVSCELCQVFTNYEAIIVSANSVTNLLEDCLKNRYPRTVLESFEIFMPEHPLKTFMEFLNLFHKLDFNNTLIISKLATFQSSLKSTRKNSMFNDTDHELTYLNNRIWIEMTALRLLSALLNCNCNSLYDQILIVENLHKIQFWEYFSCECPNFSNLLNILKALYESNSSVTLDVGVIFDIKNSRQAVISCINMLLEQHYFEVALKVAEIENLPPDLILIKEWQYKIDDRNEPNFWTNCNETFVKYNVTADCVVDFYLDCFEKLSDLLEKFTLSKLAWEWAAKYELSCQYELEKKMWLAFLCLDEKHKDLTIFNINAAVYLYKDLSDILKNVTAFEGEVSKDFLSQLERIVVFALNKGNFWLGLRLQKMFNVKSTDLETLKLCHSLAEGILLPYQLNAEQRLLLSNVNYLRTFSHRRPFLSTKFSSFSSSSHSPAGSLLMQATDTVDSSMNDTLAILKLLTEHLNNGVDIGLNIFMTYRISINIEIPYQVVVVTTDYMKTLKDALEDNCINKLDVVHDFILVYKWSKHEVADFICEELINATSNYIQTHAECVVMWDLNIDQGFQLILQLLPDNNCSMLGYKIYSYANTLHKSQIESNCSFKLSDITLVIELLIRAHDCFTADCNMEGISVILKKSKEVVYNLLVMQDWKLIVRLLTGVARYTEMNYVFQILMENDQFEFLLRKGLKKDNTLKVALLEYLKRFCPDNRDLYKIVALHFTLFSEVAMLWEREAQSIIKNLISISKLEMQNNKLNPDEEPFTLFQNTDGTKICLNKAMENYTHATEFHLQGEKLTKAMNSAKQAELIALQLGILNEVSVNGSTVCLLDLTNSQIVSLISSKLNFEQCLILVDAYNFHTDWASVLYEQYVVKQNDAFLEDFMKHFTLTDTLVQDVSRRFIAAGINTASEIKYMKNIVRNLSSLHIKYRIASELGFTDVVEDLIASGKLVYLKDTVWKRGYKN